jgi:hypothetical protein
VRTAQRLAARQRGVTIVGALALTVTAATGLLAQRSTPPRGWQFRYTIGTDTPDGASRGQEIVFDVTVWRAQARVAVRGGPLRMLVGDSGYVLVTSADTMVTAVNPTRREVLRLGSGGLAPSGPMGMAVAISDVVVRTQRRGAGARIAGFATERVESQQAYTMTVTAGSMRRSLRTDLRMAVEQSAAVLRLASGFGAFRDRVLTTLQPAAVARDTLRQHLRVFETAFPLSMHTTGSIVSGADTSMIATRGRLSDFRRIDVDTATFVPPAGFRVTEMRRLLQPRPR